MLPKWMPLVPAVLATLCFSSTAIAQRAPDPASRVWNVEVNGQLNPNEHFIYVPFVFGVGGVWINYEGERTYGFGTYVWDPVAGTIDYQNLSEDGGGGQSGRYTWDGSKYLRTRASHPEAPRLALHPQQ